MKIKAKSVNVVDLFSSNAVISHGAPAGDSPNALHPAYATQKGIPCDWRALSHAVRWAFVIARAYCMALKSEDQKKSRPDTAASSIDLLHVSQRMEHDDEIVAPAHPQAKKSLSNAGGGISKDAISEQPTRHEAPHSTSSELFDELRSLQDAFENGNGLSLFDHKSTFLRKYMGGKQ